MYDLTGLPELHVIVSLPPYGPLPCSLWSVNRGNQFLHFPSAPHLCVHRLIWSCRLILGPSKDDSSEIKDVLRPAKELDVPPTPTATEVIDGGKVEPVKVK